MRFSLAVILALGCACDSASLPDPSEPAASAPAPLRTRTVARDAPSQSSEVIVLGLIHGRHRTSQTFSLEHVRALIRAIEPDVVITEIPPDRLDTALEQFRATGQVTESRVKVFPEYTEALFPLSRELSFAIEPAAAWTQELARDRKAKLADWKVTRAEASKQVSAAQQRADKRLRQEGLRDDPWGMHGARYDQFVAEGLRPYDQLFNEELGAGGWSNINAAHIALMNAALDRHAGQGKRVLVTFGAWHKHQLLRALARRSDVRMRSVRDFLVPPEAGGNSLSDVAHARAQVAIAGAVATTERAPAKIDAKIATGEIAAGEDLLPVESCRILPGEKIHFKINKWHIKPQSFPVLDRLAETLRARPAWVVRIEGHRDARGEYTRVRITSRRAKAVRDYLVAKGIDPARLISVGYGDTRPIASNRTAAGRAKNRRVEFHIENCP